MVALVGSLGDRGGELRTCRSDVGSPCDDAAYVQQVRVNPGLYPRDGALVMEVVGKGVGAGSEGVLDALEVQVADGLGTPREGTLDWATEGPYLLWTPVQPLRGELAVTIVVANDALGSIDGCGPGNFEQSEDVTFVDETLAGAEAPLVELEDQTIVITETGDLDLMVCCDGAYPYEDVDSCKGGLSWSGGFCASTQGTGRIEATLVVAPAVPRASFSSFAYRWEHRGSQYWRLGGGAPLRFDEPGCIEVTAVRLADGEVATAMPVCTRDDLAGSVGPLELDPADALAGLCTGPLYTCEGRYDAWEEEFCEPWDGDEGSGTGGTESGPGAGGAGGPRGGCACRAAGGRRLGWIWAVVSLAWVARRRPRRTH